MSSSHDAARLDGIDVARYLSLAGMVLVNFRLAMEVGTAEGGLLAAFFHFLEGKASATFVMLAGMGLVLGTRRLTLRAAVWQTWRRALFLAVLGLVNLLIFPADILHYYACYFVLAVLWLRATPRTLAISMLALALLSWGCLLHLDYSQGWNWQTLEYSGMWQWPGFARNLLFNGFHPVLPWMVFLLGGMWLARMPLAQPRVQLALLVTGALMLAAAYAVQALAAGGAWQALLDVQPLPPGPTYLLAGLGAACTVIGACLLLMRRAGARALRALLPVGRMTLTLYVAHILVGMGTLEALGMLGNGRTLGEVAWAACVFLLLATVLGWAWSRRASRGPLEAVMRRLTG
ncbi:DUF418 domain-containing protein [Stenotrophomonas rhizophila]|uniref:DUF418 domain-containing protein n=1 Tax=Stenotrophomonas rhizophila TaxID=216778 RepID=UPI001E519D31|nr:DUF418 domain-containing protein [Stenotrophomonas rhizophila]MCC7633495.1 DUF418 domain-containing protein [Stenotrophomonas rhizophila]MCC7663020.1 DUF418 domain-containing protein [Stenotrophomonas rhizophila]